MDERLLLTEIRYIEANPVRVGIVEIATDYSFSSANARDRMDLDMIETDEFWRVPTWLRG